MAGAMASWNTRTDIRASLAQNLSLHAFGDFTGKSGRALYDLGDIYRIFKKRTFNCSVPWQVLFRSSDDSSVVEGLELAEFDNMARRLAEIEESLQGEEMKTADSAVIRQELDHLLKTLNLAAKVGKARLGVGSLDDLRSETAETRDRHRYIWLLRNRPGGLTDSLEKMLIP
jgi:hypothetical protein